MAGAEVTASAPSAAAAAAEIAWPAPDAQPSFDGLPLGAEMVHIWGWRLDAGGDRPRIETVAEPDAELDQASDGATAFTALSKDEVARAHRLVSAESRQRYTASRRGLREILAGYLDVDPVAITFERGKRGKPQVAGGCSLQFNLSHSRDVAVLAVSDCMEVGVDVEFVRPVARGLAERFFSAEEALALATLPAAERLPAFYSCWTRKEAFLKGIGVGVWGGLSDFTTTVVGPPTLRDDGSGITAGWNVEPLEPAAGYVGALAVRADRWQVQCFCAGSMCDDL